GNEGWVYNDNVKAPEIVKWLGETVGKEAEDLTRHDKWLCMMYPRLVLLKQFLAEDGAIFVSIDDNEVASLRLLMDEVFGRGNFVANLVWNHSVQAKGYTDIISLHHNHTLAYSMPNFSVLGLPRTEEHNKNYSNPDNDPRGRWRSSDVRNSLDRPNLKYNITTPSGKIIKHPPNGWRFSRATFEKELAIGKIIFSEKEDRVIRKIYLADQGRRSAESLWFANEAGTTREATQEVSNILSESSKFDTPKPTRFIQRILQIASDGPSLILDSFAGSGTTGHAVLKQNAADGGNRQFILVEMEPQIAKDITAERVRRVIEGYTDSKGKAVEGLEGGFQYCRLSTEPLFDAYGAIRDDVSFA
ncbi:MAG: site-specific DNA-methyltransferase, partial [Verrucomicrobia bacterium]|nr:site-specific DNA-methyltransferase [Verrucomicrobiota bacterium]